SIGGGAPGAGGPPRRVTPPNDEPRLPREPNLCARAADCSSMDGWPAGARLPTGKVASTVTVALVMPASRSFTRVPRLPSPAAGGNRRLRAAQARLELLLPIWDGRVIQGEVSSRPQSGIRNTERRPAHTQGISSAATRPRSSTDLTTSTRVQCRA